MIYLPPSWLYRYQAVINRGWTKKRLLAISLDCDTAEDAAAAEKLTHWLIAHKIKPTLAVPGIRLEAGIRFYKRIFHQGIDFMNHGYADHSLKTPTGYVSTNNYASMTYEQIRHDITRGHKAIINTLDMIPVGWRTPHFGTCQRPDKLNAIYVCIKSLGYKYSSSTVPEAGIIRGGKYHTANGLAELPLSGGYDFPFLTMDSWTFFAAPDRSYTPDDYFSQVKKLTDFWLKNNLPGFFNLYADPSQILNRSEFYCAINYVLENGFTPVTYKELIS